MFPRDIDQTRFSETVMAQVIRSPGRTTFASLDQAPRVGTAAKVLTEGGLNVVMLEA
jgi:hypothetical protein